MDKEISFPDLVSEEKRLLAIEIGIDFLPASAEGKWRKIVIDYTARWIEKNKISKKATLWQWACLSINFGRPGLSEFIVQFGLPERFFKGLISFLQQMFPVSCRLEYVDFDRELGWSAVCHIENGNVWVEADTNIFRPIAPQSIVKSSVEDVSAADEIEIEEMCLVREVFSRGGDRSREAAIQDVSHALSTEPSPEITRRSENIIRTAKRRGVLVDCETGNGLATQTLNDFDRNFLKQQFLASLEGYRWHSRKEAIKKFARWLGFRRTGHAIESTAESLINGLIREKRLEKAGDQIRKMR